MPDPLLLRSVRIVPVDGVSTQASEPVDVLLHNGRVAAIGASLDRPPGTEVRDLDGRFVIPGLWDHHVHFNQHIATRQRLDLLAAHTREDVLALVAAELARRPEGPMVGFGFRAGAWPQVGTVAELDAVTGDRPVILISGDGHSGWLNTAALTLLDAPATTTMLDEDDWFPLWGLLTQTPGLEPDIESGVLAAQRDAAALGIVGVTELELCVADHTWPDRYARGTALLRVRVGAYASQLDNVIASGWRTGQALPGGGDLITMGPFKVISDGSLGTRTAHCHDPYPVALQGDWPHGKQNISHADLAAAMQRAHTAGLECAIHAIGDAAMGIALDAFAETGAQGSIEHAQLTTARQIHTMADLGVRASVQPAHLLDDRDLTATCWPGRDERAFMLQTMLDAGVDLRFGSDAPIAALDPWLAMAAAVHRSADERPPWTPAEAISAPAALAASVDGLGTVAVGHPADVAVLEADPFAPLAAQDTNASVDTAAVGAHLRGIRSALTVVAGRVIHDAT